MNMKQYIKSTMTLVALLLSSMGTWAAGEKVVLKSSVANATISVSNASDGSYTAVSTSEAAVPTELSANKVYVKVWPSDGYFMSAATVTARAYAAGSDAQTRTTRGSSENLTYIKLPVTPEATKGIYSFTLQAGYNVELSAEVTVAAVSLATETFTYTGAEIKPGVKIGSETGTATNCNITYSNNTDAALSTAATAPTVTIEGQGAYWGTATKKFTINKAEISTVIFNANEQSFDFAENTPRQPGIQSVLTANGIVVPTSDYTLSGDTEKTDANSYNSTTECYDTYTLTVTAKENTNFTGSVNANWSISQADLNIKSRFKVSVGGTVYATTEQYSTEYTASAQTPAIVITDNSNGDEVVTDDHYTLSWINNTNCGTATVTITAKGNNYAGVRTETFQITKATIELSPAAHTITYGDAPSTGSVTYSQINGADFDNSVVTGAPTLSTTYTQYGDPGSYPITITVDGNNEVSGMSADNFKFVVAAGSEADKLTVGQKEVGLTWGEISFSYDGNAHAPTAAITGVVNGDDVSVAVEGGQTNPNTTETPIYTATASLTGAKAACYKLPTANTQTFTITSVALTGVTVTPYAGVYNGEAQKITVALAGDAAGATVTYSETENGTYSETAITKTDVGTYTIYYKVSKANYDDVKGFSTITITKKPITSVAVTGIAAPETTVVLDAEAVCETGGVVSAETTHAVAVSWRIGDVATAGKAKPGTVYTADVVLTADGNHEFLSTTTGTILVGENNEAATPSLGLDGKLKLSYAYPQTAGTAPTADMFEVILPDDLMYSSTEAKVADWTYADGYDENSGIGTVAVKYFKVTTEATETTEEVISPVDEAKEKGTYYVKLDVAIGTKYTAATGLTKPEWTFTIVHGHEYTYTATDNKITGTCSAEGCDLDENKATLTLVKPERTTYDDETKSAEATYTPDDGIPGADITIQYQTQNGTEWGDATTTAPTNAGTHRASITLTGKDNVSATASIDYTIAKIDPTVGMFEVALPTDLVYNGEAKTATPSVTAAYADKGVGTPTAKYFKGDEAVESAINVGTYTVKIDVAEGTNYNAATNLASAAWTFAITPNTTAPTVSVSDITAGQTPTVTVTMGTTTLTADKDYTIAYKNSAGTAVTEFTTPGTYTVVITPKDGSNYGFEPAEKTFTVAAVVKDITESIVVEVSNITTGQTPTVTVKDGTTVLGVNTDYTVVYKNSAGETVTDFSTPGTYTAVIAPVDGSAYTFTVQEKTFTVASSNPQTGDEVTVTDRGSGTGMTATVTGSKTDETTGKTVYDLTLITLPSSVLNGTTSLNGSDMTVEYDGFTYQVTKVDTKAFDGQAEGVIIYLPTGVYTTGAVTNVVNGDGTATELNLNKVTSFNAPREIKADKVTYQRTESEAYFTLCLPYGFELPDGYTSWTLERGVNGVAEFSHSRKSLKAYEPYVIEATTKTGTRGSEDVLDLSATNVTIAATGAEKSVLRDNVEMFGTVRGLTLPKGQELEAYVMEEDALWRQTPLTSSLYVPAFECYLVVNGGSSTFPSQFGEATGIWGIEGDDATGTGAWYDLNGHKLDGKPKTKGLYIYNGIKIVVK